MTVEHYRQPLDRLPASLAVRPVRKPFNAIIRPPGSKSITNRAILLGALAHGRSTLRGALTTADDAVRMRGALAQLGAPSELDETDETVLRITGTAGRWRPSGPATLDLNNAGTATRFLTAAAMLSPEPVTITGNARMRERPIAQLASALRTLGATITHEGNPDCPPLTITAPATLATHALELPTTLSSQFISALLLVAPNLPSGLTLQLSGEITSRPYIDMTLGLLARVGARMRTSEDLRVIRIAPGPDPDALGIPAHSTPASTIPCLPGFELDVEPDASGATYFHAAAALFPGARCTVPGLGPGSLQGDALFPNLLARMGATVSQDFLDDGGDDEGAGAGEDAEPTSAITVSGAASLSPIMADLSDMPDTAMTLAAVCCFAQGTSVIRGLRTLRVKETDRIAALVTELSKVGVTLTNPVHGDDGAITIEPPKGGIERGPDAPAVAFDTYDDHRMAMALALIGLRRPNVSINEPGCVAKTYPTFWQHLAGLYPN